MPRECPKDLRPLVEEIKGKQGEMTKVQVAKLVEKIRHGESKDSKS
jgi:hypothetical protein